MKQITNMSIILTEACNLRCSFCYEKTVDAVMMSKETVEKCVDFMVTRTNLFHSRIMWFGGEPLLNWQTLFHGIEYAKTKLPREALVNFVSTNGTQWNEDIRDKFLEHPDLEIQLSWQGLHELQDADRGVPALVEKNIREMIAVLPNKIQIQMQLLPDMVDKITEAVDYIYSVVGDNSGFIILRPVPEMAGWDADKLRIMAEQLQLVFVKYGKKIKRLLDCHRGFDAESLFCAPGSRFCSFAPNGDIYPCHRFYFTREQKFKLGNVDTGLADSNISRMLDGIHRYSMVGCEGCAGEKYCYICPACNYEQTKNPLKPTQELCAVNRVYAGLVADYAATRLPAERPLVQVEIPDEIDAKEILPPLVEVITNLTNQVGVLSKKCCNLESQLKFINKEWE